MRRLQRIFILTVFIVASSIFAKAQQIPDYLFLEVVDLNAKPVVGATVETSRDYRQTFKTDAEGKA